MELRIQQATREQTKLTFDRLHARRAVIESTFGEPLRWQRKSKQKTSSIGYVLPGGGLRDRDRWPEIQDRMIAAMVRLEKALKPEIERLS